MKNVRLKGLREGHHKVAVGFRDNGLRICRYVDPAIACLS